MADETSTEGAATREYGLLAQPSAPGHATVGVSTRDGRITPVINRVLDTDSEPT